MITFDNLLDNRQDNLLDNRQDNLFDNLHDNLRGLVRVSENRPPQVQTVHTPSSETVQLKVKEKKKLLSTHFPAAAAIFKMPSIS
jgi:hypothetical protein